MSTPLERFPTPEDWVAIQGGKPTILGKPDMSGTFLVVHDYGYAEVTARNLPQAGLIVPTPSAQMQESVASPLELSYVGQDRVQHDVRVPAVLLAKHHGLACDHKSYEAARGQSYDRLDRRKGTAGLAASLGLITFKLAVVTSGAQFLRPQQ